MYCTITLPELPFKFMKFFTRCFVTFTVVIFMRSEMLWLCFGCSSLGSEWILYCLQMKSLMEYY